MGFDADQVVTLLRDTVLPVGTHQRALLGVMGDFVDRDALVDVALPVNDEVGGHMGRTS